MRPELTTDNIDVLRDFIEYSVYDKARTEMNIESHHKWVNQVAGHQMIFVMTEIASTLGEKQSPNRMRRLRQFIKELAALAARNKEINKAAGVRYANLQLTETLDAFLIEMTKVVDDMLEPAEKALLN
ncbi:MAG: hypothetical protein V4594_23420 [Bacteroidota bacterium]